MKNWYSIGYWHPKILKNLKNILINKPASIIDPHYTTKVPNRDKGIRIVSERAYQGYVFIECEPENWKDIFLEIEKIDGISIPGTRNTDGYPVPVHQDEIDRVNELMNTEIAVDLTVNPGDTVIILEGGFRGMSGEVLKTDEGRGVVIIRLQVFERDIEAEFPASLLKKE